MVSMASLVLLISFLLIICMHSANGRLLPAIVKPSSAKPHLSIPLQVADNVQGEKNGGDDDVKRAPETPFSKAESEELLTGNAQENKTGGVVKEGSDIVESPSHHVGLLKGIHAKGSERSTSLKYHAKKEVTHSKNNDITVTDYQPPHRKTPIHN